MRVRTLASTLMLVPMGVLSLAAQASGIREVAASERNLIPLQTKVRYTTMILLPDDEEIVDLVCGDKDFWVMSATQNIAHVKPAREGAATNLNIVTTSGAVYSFLLTEVKNGQPDLKVYVTADATTARSRPKYVSAAQVTALQQELADTRAAVETAQRRTNDAIATFRHEYPATLQFTFGTPKYEKPFYVRAIWHDGQCTYIKSDAHELPAMYELIDGQPALVNFQVHNGTYVVPKVLERGYLALGKDRFAFQQER
jgi:type IV secretory pathway VirB9-like protein